MGVGQSSQSIRHDRNADLIGMPQQPPAERRESGPHDHRDVHLARLPNDALLQTDHGLVDHGQDHPLLQGFRRKLARTRGAGQLVDLRVGDRRPAVPVAVEPAAVLLTQPARTDDRAQDGAVPADAVAEGGLQHRGHVLGGVEPHRVQQLERPHRHAELLHRPVRGLDPDPLGQQPQRLAHVERQDPVDQESRTVLDHHRDLPQPEGELVHGDHRLRRAALPGDHLDQRHPVNRIEEVQPDHALGMQGLGRDVADRQ